MINEFRTLLLNAVDSKTLYDIGSQYTDPDYRPRELPVPLNAIYKILFTPGADGTFFNYRASQYLQAVNSTRFRDWPESLDSRITYQLSEPTERGYGPTSLWYSPLYRGVTEQLDGTTDQAVVLVNPQVAIESSAQLRETYTFEVTAADELTVTELTGSGAVSVVPFTIYHNMAEWVTYRNLMLTFECPSDTATLWAKWSYDRIYRPNVELLDVLTALKGAGVEAIQALFHNGQGDPWSTLEEVWSESNLATEQLAAALVAFVENVRAI